MIHILFTVCVESVECQIVELPVKCGIVDRIKVTISDRLTAQ